MQNEIREIARARLPTFDPFDNIYKPLDFKILALLSVLDNCLWFI